MDPIHEDDRVIREQIGGGASETEEKEMSFFDHLEELRWHLVRSVIAIMVITVAAFLAKNIVFDIIILGPTKTSFATYQWLCNLSERYPLGESLCVDKITFSIKNIHMTGQFTQHMFTSFIVGLIVASPYIFNEIWKFVKPALKKSERRYARGIVFFTSFFFLSGVLFGYFLLVPMSVQFLGNYVVSQTVQNEITLSSYISTIAGVTFACAVVFELPMAVYFLTRAGLIGPDIMRSHRKHAFVAVIILSAIITPPDVTSQLLLTIPFVFLYELSILISARVYKKKLKNETINSK